MIDSHSFDICAFFDVFYATLAKVDQMLVGHEEKKPLVLPTSTRTQDHTSLVVAEVNTKLPKIELKPFGGDILEWQTFWDQFQSAVHNKPKLADVDKFTYLKSLLKGSADNCVAGLKLTSENYKEAVKAKLEAARKVIRDDDEKVMMK